MCAALEGILPGLLPREARVDYGQWMSLWGTAVSTQVLASKLRLRVPVVPELSGRGKGKEGLSEL